MVEAFQVSGAVSKIPSSVPPTVAMGPPTVVAMASNKDSKLELEGRNRAERFFAGSDRSEGIGTESLEFSARGPVMGPS